MSLPDSYLGQVRDDLFDLAKADGFDLDGFLDDFDGVGQRHETSAIATRDHCWEYTLRYECGRHEALANVFCASGLDGDLNDVAKVIDVGCGAGAGSMFIASQDPSLATAAHFRGIDHNRAMRDLYRLRLSTVTARAKALTAVSKLAATRGRTLALFSYILGQEAVDKSVAAMMANKTIDASTGDLDVLLVTATGQTGMTKYFLACLENAARHRSHVEVTGGEISCANVWLDRRYPRSKFYRPQAERPNVTWTRCVIR